MEIKRFEATLKDGSKVTNAQYPSVSHLPKDEVAELKVEVEGFTQSPNTKVFVMKADLNSGERLHFFMRRAVKHGADGGVSRSSVFVLELSRGSERLARLYVPQDGEPIFSTSDLYFG